MDVKLNISDATSRFEWIVRNRAAPAGERWNVLLFETASFVAIPSLGSLVAGWVLIVPRTPAINLVALSASQREDLAQVREAIVGTLADRFSDEIFEFEHGPAKVGGLLGCGVEQAHLHVAPLPFDLLAAISTAPEAGAIDVSQGADPWAQVRPDTDYWLARHARSGASVIAYPDKPISQGIRRIIATRTGRPDAWNYRADPNLENVDATLRAFSDMGT